MRTSGEKYTFCRLVFSQSTDIFLEEKRDMGSFLIPDVFGTKSVRCVVL